MIKGSPEIWSNNLTNTRRLLLIFVTWNNHKQNYKYEQQSSTLYTWLYSHECTREEHKGNTFIPHVQDKTRQTKRPKHCKRHWAKNGYCPRVFWGLPINSSTCPLCTRRWPPMPTGCFQPAIVKVFLILHKYTFRVFRQRARAILPSIICLYAHRGDGGAENGHFLTTRKQPFGCSRWPLES